ncbi:MAG: aminotransferase class V-fold PLP-dependent enzyme [Syntrophorhabdaceae bacterium]|nr:aminotransferase class V-fold PLP-dependent enzyme [Syntrophorhabdaceae bacterium]
MPIDVSPIRAAEFPVSSQYLYFNHAGVSPLPASAAEAGIRAYRRSRDEGAMPIRHWEGLIQETRGRFASIVGASPEEIAFVKSTSEGLSFVAAGFPWKEGDNLVTTNVEFPSNIYPWMRLQTRNVEVRMICAKDGWTRKEDLFAACDGKTRLITLSSVEFLSGFRNDLSSIGEYCQKNGIFFCVDGIQSLGVLPMDVKSFGIDAVSADSHKWLMGPDGIGGFYISRDVMDMIEPVILGWHSVKNRFDFDKYDFRMSPDAQRYEPGCMNTNALTVFNASMELLLSTGIDRIWERVRMLTDLIFEKARESGYEILSSEKPEDRSGIVTIRIPRVDNAALWKALQNRKVMCASRNGGIRLSPHFYNTPEEVEAAFDILREEKDKL